MTQRKTPTPLAAARAARRPVGPVKNAEEDALTLMQAETADAQARVQAIVNEMGERGVGVQMGPNINTADIAASVYPVALATVMIRKGYMTSAEWEHAVKMTAAEQLQQVIEAMRKPQSQLYVPGPQPVPADLVPPNGRLRND